MYLNGEYPRQVSRILVKKLIVECYKIPHFIINLCILDNFTPVLSLPIVILYRQ